MLELEDGPYPEGGELNLPRTKQGLLPVMSGLPTILDSSEVMCQKCKTWFVPEAGWWCPGCGERAAFGVQPGECPDCGTLANMLRRGQVVKTLCPCRIPPEKIARAERLRDRDRDREERERANVEAGRKTREQAKQAGACWKKSKQQCAISESALPFPYCHKCPRFTKS